MADMSSVRGTIEARIAELDDERRALEDALAALGRAGADASRQVAKSARRGARDVARAAKEVQKAPGRARRGRRPGTGARQAEALKIVKDNPGIGITELSKKMGMKNPNYLYRVMPALQKQGQVRKRGKGWHAA
jgi:hypothetical protein